MPAPKTHYRIALGENNGKHSWIIHSSKGIKWRNIPDELVELLEMLSIDELLDFSLGSDGRWYISYCGKGPERHEVSPHLLIDLSQESDVELERLTLGPGDSHWGVRRSPDGLLQPFSSVTNRFARLMDPNTDSNEFNSQIDFVSLGYGASWALGVKGRVEYRCGKPFRNKLMDGQRARKRVSAIVLSPMARVWIIVWEDGTLSHNLPSNIAAEVEDYCQLRHSLQKNSRRLNYERQRPQNAGNRGNNQAGPSSSTPTQLPTTNQSQTASQGTPQNNAANMVQSSLARITTNPQSNLASDPVATLVALAPLPPAPTELPLPRRLTPFKPTLVRQPVPRAAPAQLPMSPTPVAKAPWLLKPEPTQGNPAQESWMQNDRVNVTSNPSPPPPPVLPKVNVTPLREPQAGFRCTPSPNPVTKPAPAQLPTASSSFPRTPYTSIVKPVQATQATTLATSQVPLTWNSMNLLSGASSQSGRTSSRVETVLTKPYFYIPPRKLLTTLRVLDLSDWSDLLTYRKIARLFVNGWKHQHKQLPKIKRILVVNLPDHLNESYDEYKDLLDKRNGSDGANEELVFHGTSRECYLGEEGRNISLCEEMTCCLCGILRTSFLVSKAGSAGRSFNRFGSGIYTSSVSSQADDYATSPWLSNEKAMIVAKVALGNSSIHYRISEHLTAPPWGYDSVKGEVGIDLSYNEQVVYKNEAIRPAYIVIYERSMRTSPPVVTPPRLAPQSARSNMKATKTNSSSSRGCTIM